MHHRQYDERQEDQQPSRNATGGYRQRSGSKAATNGQKQHAVAARSRGALNEQMQVSKSRCFKVKARPSRAFQRRALKLEARAPCRTFPSRANVKARGPRP